MGFPVDSQAVFWLKPNEPLLHWRATGLQRPHATPGHHRRSARFQQPVGRAECLCLRGKGSASRNGDFSSGKRCKMGCYCLPNQIWYLWSLHDEWSQELRRMISERAGLSCFKGSSTGNHVILQYQLCLGGCNECKAFWTGVPILEGSYYYAEMTTTTGYIYIYNIR